MTTTTNFGFNIPDGTDNVNLLTQNYPNWTNLDAILKAIKDTGITEATATKTGTNFAVVRSDSDCKVFRFVATANYASGDSFTVDGVPVTATSVAGTALESGAFVINQTVLAALNGTVLTIYVGGGLSSVDANDVDYDNSVSGLTATDVQAAIDELEAEIEAIPSTVAASAVTYDNTVSGLTATDVQAALDELKSLIASHQYVTTGLSIVNGSVIINDGGYYIDDNNIVHVDITVTTLSNQNQDNGLIQGFPQGASIGTLTPAFNNLIIKRTAVSTFLVAATSIAAGTTLHFIGSYSM